MERPEFDYLSFCFSSYNDSALLTESHGLYQYYILKTLSEHYANIIAQSSEQ